MKAQLNYDLPVYVGVENNKWRVFFGKDFSFELSALNQEDAVEEGKQVMGQVKNYVETCLQTLVITTDDMVIEMKDLY